MSDSYHDRPEWSYSQMKVIIDRGIDYAVAVKRKQINQKFGKAVDLGELAHMFILGGHASKFEVSLYDNYRTKEAREWQAEKQANGKTIIDKPIYDDIDKIVDMVEAHPRSKELIKGKDVQHEVEMFAKINGVDLRGKADAILKTGDSLVITDVKTTAKFDQWHNNKYYAMNQHYDLQAANYSAIAASAYKISPSFVNFYFCVVETVYPFRVQYHHASPEFIEHGEAKLAKCLEQIKNFGDREPNFLIEEVNELGDFSL